MHDVIVVGAGPAGLALAAATAERGLDVAIVAPGCGDAPPRWAPTYCAWADELAAVGHADVVAHRWEHATVNLGAGRTHTLDRAYVLVDKQRLAERLYTRVPTRIDGTAASVTHGPAASEITLVDGRALSARVVVDAAGHRPVLLPARPSAPPALQTAVGRMLVGEGLPWPSDRALLMDFDPGPLGEDPSPPSFLYVLPLGPDRAFVEETVLAARPAVPAEVLRQRLDRRLAALGVVAETDGPEEWVHIPMGGDIRTDPRVLAYGSVSGMIHPATGYLLPRALGAASRTADALVAGLTAPGGSPAAAVAAANAALWSPDHRRRRALYRFGLEALLAMNPATTRGFFHAFFLRPRPEWAGYLSDTHDAPALRAVMWRLFAGASLGLKWNLARAGFGAEGVALAAAHLGG